MHSRERKFGPFWNGWQVRCQGMSRRQARQAWREYLREYFGQSPEKHWFFGGRRFAAWRGGPFGPGTSNPLVGLMLSKSGGLLPLYVLHLLDERPRYGNEVMREIEERTKGQWASNPGAIYPLLSFMEMQGLVEGRWEEPRKRTRRFYRLTERGREELQRLKEVMRPGLQGALTVLQDLLNDLYGAEGEPLAEES